MLDLKLVVICGLQSHEGIPASDLSLCLLYSTQMAHMEPGQTASAILAALKWPSCDRPVGHIEIFLIRWTCV